MSLTNKTTAGFLASLVAGVFALVMSAPADAQMIGMRTPAPSAPPACGWPPELARFNRALRHTARRLASGEPLTIVAIGSSSTAGAGATSPAASYPSRLAVELAQRFPGRDITVLNRGVNGEETEQMLARFDTAVIAAHPALVLWQIGTNSVLREYPLKSHSVLLREGIARLKQAGADVVLIDMQYTPDVLAKSETPGMDDQIALAAKEENVDLFSRFARHARLARGSAHLVRRLRLAGPAAHERLELCLRGETPCHRDRRSGNPPGRIRGTPAR